MLLQGELKFQLASLLKANSPPAERIRSVSHEADSDEGEEEEGVVAAPVSLVKSLHGFPGSVRRYSSSREYLQQVRQRACSKEALLADKVFGLLLQKKKKKEKRLPED